MRKKSLRSNTLKKVLFIHVCVMWIILLGVALLCLYNAVGIMKSAIVQAETESIRMYVAELEADFARAADWLTYPDNTIDNIVKSGQTDEQTSSALIVSKIQETLNKVSRHLGAVSGFLYYEKETDIYLESGEDVNQTVKQLTRQYVSDESGIPGEWFLAQKEDRWYFLRLVQREDFVIGSYFELEQYITEYNILERSHSTYLTLATPEVIQNSEISEKNIINLIETETLKIDNENYVVIKAEFNDVNCYLCSIVKRQELFSELDVMRVVVSAFLIFMTVMGAYNIRFLYRKIHEPVKNLVGVMEELGNGDVGARIHVKSNIAEWQEAGRTFNEMADKIEALKIDVYEETIKRQNVNMLYLQSQLKPHFLVNCLNVIRGLARKNETKKIEELTMYLSTHIRESLTLETRIPLKRELYHVRQYIALQQMRYSDKMVLMEDIEENVLEAIVPPMLLLTFVENSVKYQIGEDGSLQVMITLRKAEDSLVVIIEDNGEGFSKEILAQLQNQHQITDERGEHVGIYNVCQRLQILYKEKATVKFYNREQGGAVVEISIPYETE